MNKRRLIRYAVALGLVAWLATGVFTVDQTEVGVVARFGQIQHVRSAGLNFKLPWPIDRVYRVDNRLLYMSSGAQELLTQDQKNLLVGAFLVWQVSDPKLFVTVVKTRQEAETRLRDLVKSRMGAMVGNLLLENLVSVGPEKVDIHLLSHEALGQVHRIVQQNMGVGIRVLQIETFSLPPENRPSVIARMKSERQMIAARYRSEGMEAAMKIEAKAASNHKNIMADAHAKATEILGTADADALRIMGAAYDKNPEFYKFLRSLKGYEAIIDEKTTLFLPADSKLLEVLHDAE